MFQEFGFGDELPRPSRIGSSFHSIRHHVVELLMGDGVIFTKQVSPPVELLDLGFAKGTSSPFLDVLLAMPSVFLMPRQKSARPELLRALRTAV